MDKAERLALAAQVAPRIAPFLERRADLTRSQAASAERRADVTGSLDAHENSLTARDEQLAMLQLMGDMLDQDYQEARAALVEAGWTPGTSLLDWIGCTAEELQRAIEASRE